MRARDDQSKKGRGLGPFSGTQLTIVIVAIAAIFAIPTAALAAGQSFTSGTTAAAVNANNTSAKNGAVAVYGKQLAKGSAVRFGVRGGANGAGGIGVEGAGKKYGVFSNGPFAVNGNATVTGNIIVGPGKSLACTGCVGTSALSPAARQTQPLASGESESGVFNVADNYPLAAAGSLQATLSFARPVSGGLSYAVILAGGAKTANCPAVGSAARGVVCVYGSFNQDVASPSGFAISSSGGGAQWVESGGGFAFARGTFTVTAP